MFEIGLIWETQTAQNLSSLCLCFGLILEDDEGFDRFSARSLIVTFEKAFELLFLFLGSGCKQPKVRRTSFLPEFFHEFFEPIFFLDQLKHIVLAFIAQVCSYTGPTTIDHNIGAGDIGRFIAGKE